MNIVNLTFLFFFCVFAIIAFYAADNRKHILLGISVIMANVCAYIAVADTETNPSSAYQYFVGVEVKPVMLVSPSKVPFSNRQQEVNVVFDGESDMFKLVIPAGCKFRYRFNDKFMVSVEQWQNDNGEVKNTISADLACE